MGTKSNLNPDLEKLNRIEEHIGSYVDFPKPGILFRDIQPLLLDPGILNDLTECLKSIAQGFEFDRIVGIESRGFLIGLLVARALSKPLVLVRKKGKLPGPKYSMQYDLEYGQDVIEIEQDALPKNSKCLLVDDLLATGGTMAATKKLVEMSGSEVAGCLVIIELLALKGKAKLGETKLRSLIQYSK